MEYPWRPMPQSGHVCPVCSNPHFPFCIPPPPQYYRRPPPPPDQLFHSPLLPLPAAYNPFIDHQGGREANLYSRAHPTPQVPARPWNPNSNYSKDCYPNFNPRLDHDNNGPVTAKRFRFDIVDENYPGRLLVEDERRLKLIRDHGVVGHCSEMISSTGYRFRSNSFGHSNLGDTRISGNPEYGEKQFPYQHTENEKNVNDGYGYVVRESRMHRSPGRTNEVQLDDNADFQEHANNVATESWEFKNQLNHFPEAHSNKQHVVEPRMVQYGIGNQVQSSLLTSPSPSILAELSMFRSSEPVVSSLAPFHLPFTKVPEIIAPVSNVYSNLSGSYSMKKRAVSIASAAEKPSRDPSLDQPKIVDASHIIKHPHRANRPDHIVIILRGLPGSGKSYMAKVLRDLEIENGGSAPRIYSMDEYFMTEVEKVEESVRSRSSGSVRGKKTVTKKVMEYCYEPEMEEAYRASMLRAFKKTLDEGTFPLVIVDDRNLRVADFAQFWATAKRSGYEVYLLEAEYKDPAGCAARNIHGFTQNEIHKLASRWEEAPSLYMKLDIKSLLQGDDSEENGIQEVDMDAEDENHVICTSGSEATNIPKIASPQDGDLALDAPLKEERAKGSEEHQLEVVKELGNSKWSNDLDEDGLHKTEPTIGGNSSALSSLVRSYEEKGKSVRWADQIGRIGFSIGARTTASVSLIIGAGSGYNSKSNPVVEEERLGERNGESRRRNVFEEQLRAERESFRAVFDMRKQRITGLPHGHEQ